MLLVSLISYIDRNTLAILAPTMNRELGLNNQQYGWVVTGFSLAYMLGSPLWGIWLDRFGLLRAMSVAVAFWTLASLSHVAAAGFLSLAAARIALGFGEGATFPGGLRTAVQTLPPSLRAKGLAIAFSGGSLGAIVTPLIVNPIFQRWGWPAAFWFTGAIGLAWILLWQLVARRPSFATASPSLAAPDHAPAAPRPGFRNPLFWGFSALYAFGCLPLGFILYFGALYLGRLGLTQGEINRLIWLPPLGWEIGYFFWGWFTDRHRENLSFVIRLLVLLGLPFLLIPLSSSPYLAVAGMFWAMFVAAGFIIGSLAFGTHSFGKHHAGFVAGLGAGAWSALVGATMPLFGWLFDQGNESISFIIVPICPVLGYLAWKLSLSSRWNLPPTLQSE